MGYKLCKDYENMIRCDGDCRKCANLVYDALTNENKILKMRLDTLTEKCDRQVEAHNKLYDAYWGVKGERDRIYDELKDLKSKKMVPLSDVYRIIAGHNDYHGNSILSALTCVAEGKYVDPVAIYEPVNDALTDENKELTDKCQELEEKLEIANARLHTERVSYDYLSSLYKKLTEKCAKLEKENAQLDKECEKLHEDNKRLANGCSELVKKSDPVIFQYAYGELSDKIESLKEDIIRLDKCLSRRPCVKEERDAE